jgi:hypothetical protein
MITIEAWLCDLRRASEEETVMSKILWKLIGVLLLLGALVPAAAQDGSDGGALFPRVLAITQRSCSSCHDWASTYEGLTDPVRCVPFQPENSPLYTTVADNSMPIGETLKDEEKQLIYEWISSGAARQQSAAPAAAGAESPGSTRFLGFPNKVRFHQVAGFTSASLFLAAGIVGTVQWATFISEGHDFRDEQGIDEDEIGSVCYDKISEMWNDPMHQALRWTHVGLITTGNLLYLANAVTGVSMLSKEQPGLGYRDLHRYAFFLHGTLMIAEIVMGLFTTSVLEKGDHDQVRAFAIAHTAVGFAIPAVMIFSGIAVDRGFPRRQ